MFLFKDNEVLVVPCKSYDRDDTAKAYEKVFEYFTLDKIKGKSVYIKPNILKGDPPSRASTTHPEIIFPLAKYFVEADCDVSCGDSPNFVTIKKIIDSFYKTAGLTQVVEEAGAKTDNSAKGTTVEGGKYLGRFKMLTNVLNSDIVVNAAKAKTHSFTGYTGAVKNLFGVIPGAIKGEMHLANPAPKDFTNILIDICQRVNADLHIVDAVIGMEGPGPAAGTPKQLGAIVAGTNPYAVDEVVVELMGIDKNNVELIHLARERGLTKGIDDIKILGADLKSIKEGYSPFEDAVIKPSSFWKVLSFVLPKKWILRTKKKPYVQDNCIACGVCAEACPPNAITMENKAVIDYSKCIRCYCCQELCPAKAIVIGKKNNEN